MKLPAAPPPARRGLQARAGGMHWRLDGAGGRTAPLVLGLHGYGTDEDFFAAVLQKLFARRMKFLLPRAPSPADAGLSAANGGSWYRYDGNQERFFRELVRVESELLAFLRDVEAAEGMAPAARFVLGFSQGGYCGSWLALRNPEVFRGLVVSGARVKTELLAADLPQAAASGLGVLLCHGERDRSVPPEAARRSRDELAAAGVRVELRMFEVGHTMGRGQVDVIGDWLEAETARGAPA